MVSIKANGALITQKYHYLKDITFRMSDKLARNNIIANSGFQQLLSSVERFKDKVVAAGVHVDNEDAYFHHIERCIPQRALEWYDKIIITVATDNTCKFVYDFFLSHYGLDTSFIVSVHGEQPPCVHFDTLDRFDCLSAHLLVTTDEFADKVLMNMRPDYHVKVINYDANTHGPAQMHHDASTCLQNVSEWQILKEFNEEYEVLHSRVKKMRKQQQKVAAGASTTLVCWWRRSQLALKHRTLSRIRMQKEKIAAERDHAAKSIQIWRRYIVFQRKKRRQEAAARSNPLRDRGLPLPPRSRSTIRRDKRNAKGWHTQYQLSKNEEGLLATIRELQQSVQALQEANKSMEKNMVYLLQQLRDKDDKLSCSNSSASNNHGTIKKSAHHHPSELSCRGNVIGATLHEPSVSGLSSRESVLDNSHRHGGENLHHHDATITQQQVIGAVLPSESSGRENVLDESVKQSSGLVRSKAAPISSSRGKSSRRRRRRRRRRHRSKRWKRIDRTLQKGAALAISHIPTPNHPVSQPDLLPMSTFCEPPVVASRCTTSEPSICREKPMSYLSALLGNATNIG